MSDCKISYIATVYNLEKYICQCVDSVIPNLQDGVSELLIIDDGSTDNTASIADDYAKNYPLVRVIHQINKGLAAARNTGCREARGEYLCYLDGDDYLTEWDVGLTELAVPYLNGEVDILFFDRLTENEDGGYIDIPKDSLQYFVKSSFYKSSKFKTGKPYENVHITTAWGKFYRKAFLVDNGLWNVENVTLAQDIIFNLMLYAKGPKMAAIDRRYYYHRIILDSGCHKYRPNYLDISMKFIAAMNSIIENYYDGDEEKRALSHCAVINLLANNLFLNICNKNNKGKLEERRAQLDSVLAIPEYAAAVEKCDVRLLSGMHRSVLELCKAGDIRKLDKLIQKEQAIISRRAYMTEKHPRLLKLAVKFKAILRKK